MSVFDFMVEHWVIQLEFEWQTGIFVTDTKELNLFTDENTVIWPICRLP